MNSWIPLFFCGLVSHLSTALEECKESFYVRADPKTLQEVDHLVCLKSMAAVTNTRVNQDAHTLNIHDWPKPSVKIVGGIVVKITEAPYQVSIRNANGQHFCGGTIISSRSVLTAAHCVIGTSRRLYVVAGVDNVDGGYLNPVTIAVVHKDFNNITMEYDLAVLRVGKDLNLDNVTKKALPIATEVPPDGTICKVSGWGSTYYDPGRAAASISLRMTDLPIYNVDRCRMQVQDLPNGQICAGYENGGHDSCQGDSGGPLQCKGMITGIVSWGINCGIPRLPGVYTSVPFYKDWIQLHINSASSSLPDRNGLMTFSLISLLLIVHFWRPE